MSARLLQYDPYPDGSCRSCRGPVNPETWLCARCGAAHGEKNRCPHCRTIARTLPHPELRHRCSVCGKPRLPPGPGSSLPAPQVAAALLRANHAHRTVGILTVLFFLLLAFGLFSLATMLLFLWVSSAGPLGLSLGLLLGALPLLLAAYSRIGRQKAQSTREQALLAAYSEQIIATLTELGTAADSKQIAAWFGLGLDDTESLLAKLNVDERMTTNITDEGELEYAVIDPARRVPSAELRVPSAELRVPSAEPRVRVQLEESSTRTPRIVEAELDDAANASPETSNDVAKPLHRT